MSSAHSPRNNSATLTSSLLLGLRQFDNDAWRRLDYLYAPVVRGWCRGAGLSPEDAADVQQEVFRAVVGHVSEFRRERPGDSFRGWLWRITQNKLRDHWRRQQRKAQAAGGTEHQQQLLELPAECSADVPAETGAAGAGEVYRRALELIRSEFESRTWQAFWRLAVDGQPASVVAAELGMSLGAAYVARSRVLRRLREEFAEVLS